MNPDSVIIAWVEREFGIKWDDLSVEERDDFRRRYNEQKPVLQVETLHERVQLLLCHALEDAIVAHSQAYSSIRAACNLIRTADFIALHAVNGKVRVEESGRDCDGVQYSGLVREIDATWQAFEAMHDEIAEYADGPFHLRVMEHWEPKPEYVTRDLVMEAYENGHPHHIVSRFP